jgi:hypothetical protein
MAGAETAIIETKVSRLAQIVEFPIWPASSSVRIQRRGAAIITNIPEQRRRLMTSLRRRGVLTFQIKGIEIDRIPASVLVRCALTKL